MYLDENMMDMLCDIEEIIGSDCFNPSSYNGYTGEYGKEFRYPVKLPIGDDSREYHDFIKVNGNIMDEARYYDIKPFGFSNARYEFGSNHLYIGEAIIRVLEYLEQRYELDFNDLENTYYG